MAIEIFRERCIGAGNCVAVSPKYFDLDDDGLVILKQDVIDEGDLDEVERAAAMCPALAIELQS
ncbi:ferredoxin [Microbacterium suwonense]|uniref:Ferredoxin n=1 Tax=Microbacterium suwonense TaxID=683047 RepID=A0ABM8FUW9_9MICO|nr:ferredoxin [Microbacterium suwonense]BDZ39308.1 ferredoxin [Microbacterium suwonense]